MSDQCQPTSINVGSMSDNVHQCPPMSIIVITRYSVAILHLSVNLCWNILEDPSCNCCTLFIALGFMYLRTSCRALNYKRSCPAQQFSDLFFQADDFLFLIRFKSHRIVECQSVSKSRFVYNYNGAQ